MPFDSKEYYRKNRERILQNAREYYQAHKEQKRAYAQAHKKEHADYCKTWRAKNPQRARDIRSRHTARRKETMDAAKAAHEREIVYKWRKENIESYRTYQREYHREWARRNADKIAKYIADGKAKKGKR